MKQRKAINERCKRNLEYLKNHFTPEYLESMSDPKEYVVGFGNNNKSFCYLVEAGTKEIGDIRGATSSKFGLWYGTHGDDKELKYRATKQHFDGDVDKAFNSLKNEIARIIRKSEQLTVFKEIKSILSPMFKYKIMYIYNPSIMLPAFFLEDLQHFEDCLGLPISKKFEDAQKSLLAYRDSNYCNQTNHEFMSWLYSEYGKFNVSQTKDVNEEADNKLNKKLLKEKAPTEQYETHPVDKVDLKKGNGGSLYYPRDPKVAAIALNNADYKCENNEEHECFIRRSNDLPYTEVHHLIPLACHYKFNKSLDIPENIISLCSNCHNEIHYGKNADQLIEKFYNLRKDKLKEAGIEITLKALLDMYHRIGETK